MRHRLLKDKFFTFVEPASAGCSTHYTGVRLFQDRIVLFDPAVGVLETDAVWDGEKVLKYVQHIARDYGLAFERDIPETEHYYKKTSKGSG